MFLEAVLTSIDLVAIVPSRRVRDRVALQVIEPPLEVPEFEILMLGHERVHRDPAHRWLREHVATSVGASDPPAP